MTTQQAGVVLMILPLLWLAYKILRAQSSMLSLVVWQLMLAVTLFAAGRLAAGEGLFTIFFGG